MIAPIRQDLETNGRSYSPTYELTVFNLKGDTKEPPAKKMHTSSPQNLPSNSTAGNMLNPPKEYVFYQRSF
jgi:hypothetical protein